MRLRIITILLFYFPFCFGQLEGYQFIGFDQFIIINDKNRISFKLNLGDDSNGITGFKIAGSGDYRINKTRRRIKVFVDNSIDSLESEYKLTELIESDTTSVNLIVFDGEGKLASAINTCYVLDNKTYGTITDKNGRARLEFSSKNIPEHIKVYSLLNVPAYIPVEKMRSAYYNVYLKNESINFIKGGVIELKVFINSDLKEIKLESIKVLKNPVNICL